MKYIFSIVFYSFSLVAIAQMPSPIHWEASLQKQNNEHIIAITANIDEGWDLYSQHMDEDGPVPTSFEYTLNKKSTLIGDTEELSKPLKKFSELFEMEVVKFKNKSEYNQKVTLDGHGTLSIDVTYMTCNGNKCLPPRTETIALTF